MGIGQASIGSLHAQSSVGNSKSSVPSPNNYRDQLEGCSPSRYRVTLSVTHSSVPHLISSPHPQFLNSPVHHFPNSSNLNQSTLKQLLNHQFPNSPVPQFVSSPIRQFPNSSVPQFVSSPIHRFPNIICSIF
jgi:hypothetical protein